MTVHSAKRRGRGIAGRRDEAKYEAILDAAVQVMAESGYHHSQISRIAKAAGVADGTVYLAGGEDLQRHRSAAFFIGRMLGMHP